MSPGRGASRGHEVHETVVAGTSGHPVSGSVLATFTLGDEHLEGAADECPVLRPREIVLQGHETLIALLHNGSAAPARSIDAAGVPGRGEYWKVNAPANEPARTTSSVCLEVRLGLAGEAHDDVGGDRRFGHGGTYPLEDAEVTIGAIGAPHPLEHVVGPGLQGHVQRRHHVGRLGHRLDDVVGEVAGMRRREPHPLQAVDVTAGAKQLRERTALAELDAIGVDVLPEQRHLQDALLRQGL